MLLIQEKSDGISFKVYVQPRASKNALAGLHGDALKIRLTAAPVENAANKMCIAYLSKCLGVPKSFVEITSGHTSRTKQILLKYKDPGASASEGERLKRLINGLL